MNVYNMVGFDVVLLGEHLSKIKEVTRWIPISESLPEENTLVLTINSTTGIERLAYRRGTNWEISDNVISTQLPTHWFPIPTLEIE